MGRKIRQAVALIGVILILLMVIATLVVGCIDFEMRDRVFNVLLMSDFIVPVFLYFFLRVWKLNTDEVKRYVNALEECDEEDKTDKSDMTDKVDESSQDLKADSEVIEEN